MKKLFKYLICKIYYKYYFTKEAQSNLFITYYFPCVFEKQPAGTYVALKLNEKTGKFAPIIDIIHYPII